MLCANVDKAVKILARFIVEDKTAVIKLLNDGNYASLPVDASIMEVNEAVANNIFDEKFVKKLADVIFDIGYANQSGIESAASAGEGLNPVAWASKILEIGSDIWAVNKQEATNQHILEGQYLLETQRIERESEIAQTQAKQDFAFQLLEAQRRDAQDNSMSNIVLLLGVVGFLAISYYAIRRRDNQPIS